MTEGSAGMYTTTHMMAAKTLPASSRRVPPLVR